MRVNKKEKNVDAVCNNILLDLIWQSNITQGWHPCRGRLGGSSGMNILRCAFLSHILIYYSPRANDCRRQWQPTPGFLPGESHVQRSLVGYSPWGQKESDTTE